MQRFLAPFFYLFLGLLCLGMLAYSSHEANGAGVHSEALRVTDNPGNKLAQPSCLPSASCAEKVPSQQRAIGWRFL
jgi:hypothetical protein